MDMHGKQGEVYLQHQKHGEKWKRYWLALYPASRHGIARLELSEAASERSSVVVRRQPERKVLRLADCVSVVKLPPHAEACPRENMAAFCVEMEDKKLVFAAERESCGEWVDIMCKIAFQKHTKSAPQPVPRMEDNQIYMSREQLSEFKVLVLQSEASARCGLKGQYWLQAAADMLILQDLDTKRTLLEWPYKLLRRYGQDKMVFSIEAGRRCDSGPGTFNFETRQSDEILRLIESAIRQQQSLNITGERNSPHSPRSRSPRSPLPKRPDSTDTLEMEGNNSPNPADALGPNIYAISKPASPVSFSEAVYASPADSITSKGTHSDPGGRSSLTEPVYSDPAVLIGRHETMYPEPDIIKSHHTVKKDPLPTHYNDATEPVYSDPADLIRPKYSNSAHGNPTENIDSHPAKTTSNKDNHQEPVYAEVYDHVALNLNKKPEQKIEEPIYSVPEVVMSTQIKNSQQNKMLDDNQPIYSKVNKPPKNPQPLLEKLSQTSEIISDDLGMI